MCFAGAGMIGGVASAMSSIAGFEGQQEQYQQQLQAYNQNYQDALADNRADETTLTERQMQENQAYAEKDHLAAIEGAQKASEVRAAAASGNVSGITVNNLVDGIGADINEKRAILETNWRNTGAQIQSQKDTSVVQEIARIQQVPDPFVPDPTGALLGAVGGLFGGAAKSTSAGFFGTPAPSTTLSTPAASVAATPDTPQVDPGLNTSIGGIGMM